MGKGQLLSSFKVVPHSVPCGYRVRASVSFWLWSRIDPQLPRVAHKFLVTRSSPPRLTSWLQWREGGVNQSPVRRDWALGSREIAEGTAPGSPQTLLLLGWALRFSHILIVWYQMCGTTKSIFYCNWSGVVVLSLHCLRMFELELGSSYMELGRKTTETPYGFRQRSIWWRSKEGMWVLSFDWNLPLTPSKIFLPTSRLVERCQKLRRKSQV